jgi:Domain of unknown function (DUF4386)
MKSPRFAPLSGIAFVVLLVVGFIPVGGDTPSIDDSASKITNFYADNQGKEIAAVILVALAALFLAVFAVALRDYLRAGNPGRDFWPTVALVGAVVAVAGLFVAGGAHIALIDGGDKKIDPSAMVALNAIDNDNFLAFSVPLGIMLFGVAGAVLKDGAALPKWLAWVGIVLGIVYFTPVGFISFMLTGIWIIVASILMYQRSAPAAPAATPTA